MIRNLFLLGVLVALGTMFAPAVSADVFTFNVDYCGDPCLGGVAANNNGGTVTVTSDGTFLGTDGTTIVNIVDVLVSLSSNLAFHHNGLDSFGFNISGDPALTCASTNPPCTGGTLAANTLKVVNAGGGTWTLDQPAGNTDGAGGSFDYSLVCAESPGKCTGSPATLEFQVAVTGLTPASFETLTGASNGKGGNDSTNVDFAANVANLTDNSKGVSCTGMIGAGHNGDPSIAATAHTDGTACANTSTTVPEPTSVLLLGTVLAFAGRLLKKKLAA